MKNYTSLIKIFFISALFFMTGCVHDDIYSEPDLTNYQCANLDSKVNKTLLEVKTAYANITTEITDDIYIKGYVSSSDETGNIYKTIYIQDDPTNPTEGLTISVDAVSTYAKFPQGSLIYISLKGLAFGKYGSLLQVGKLVNGVFGRIPEKDIPNYITRNCKDAVKIVPKVMTLAEITSTNIDKLAGILIQINNAEFAAKNLCTTYAPSGTSVDKQINDPTLSTATRVVRNSGFATFANQILPSGNGKFVGILSKYQSNPTSTTTYQFYINNVKDLDMTGTRIDGAVSPCTPPNYSYITIKQAKTLYTGAMSQITQNSLIKGRVTSSDQTGNHYKYVYFEDETGGIKLKINKIDLYLDSRFAIGSEIIVSLKDLYINSVGGEIQLGALYLGNFGNIEDFNIYKNIWKSSAANSPLSPTLKTISTLSTDDVGKWIKIKDLEFIDGDLGKAYAAGTTTNRTLQDCSGKTVLLRTSNLADFASKEIDGGKADVYGILSIFNGQYQLWINDLLGAHLSNPRCDGSVYVPLSTIFNEDFSGTLTTNWTAVSVTGNEVWNIQQFGNPKPCVVMNGFSGGNKANEDWLISNPISLAGYTAPVLSFESDVRYAGNAIEVFVTENYTGNTATTTWTKLNPVLDTNNTAFGDWANSGNLDLNAFTGKSIRVALKYTSTTSAAATWEIDNIKVKGKK